MRKLRIKALSLMVLAILMVPMLGINSSISLADHQLASGVIVPLRMNTSLSSGSARVGQTWSATVTQDVYESGTLVIPRGSIVEGQVVNVDRADRFQGSGKLGIDFNRIIFPNGTRAENINAMLTSLDPDARARIDE